MRCATIAWLGAAALLALDCASGRASGDGGAGAMGGGGGAGLDGGAGSSGGTVGAADAGGALCSMDFTPCGGDLVGTWRSEQRCLPQQITHLPGGCQGETFDLTGVVTTGLWTFNADLTFTFMISAAGTATVTAPDACVVAVGGTPLACSAAEAGAMYASRIRFSGGTPGAPMCQEAGGACVCTIPFVPDPASASGSYSTSGTTLTANFGNGGDPADYCVSSNILKMGNHGSDSAPGIGVYDKQ